MFRQKLFCYFLAVPRSKVYNYPILVYIFVHSASFCSVYSDWLYRGHRDHMVVGFLATYIYAISAYHH